jgi:hypothetical protein
MTVTLIVQGRIRTPDILRCQVNRSASRAGTRYRAKGGGVCETAYVHLVLRKCKIRHEIDDENRLAEAKAGGKLLLTGVTTATAANNYDTDLVLAKYGKGLAPFPMLGSGPATKQLTSIDQIEINPRSNRAFITKDWDRNNADVRTTGPRVEEMTIEENNNNNSIIEAIPNYYWKWHVEATHKRDSPPIYSYCNPSESDPDGYIGCSQRIAMVGYTSGNRHYDPSHTAAARKALEPTDDYQVQLNTLPHIEMHLTIA